MKKTISIALVLVMALSLLTACGGDSDTATSGGSNGTNPPASQSGNGNDTSPSGNTGGDSKLANEWPKAIYDPYNIPAYTDGNIVCVDKSPYSIPSAGSHVEGSAVRIENASFSTLIAYVKDLKTANIAIMDSDITSLEKKEDDSGSVSVALSDGKIVYIGWWGYQDQKDFYYDDAGNKISFTYNLEFFIYQ